MPYEKQKFLIFNRVKSSQASLLLSKTGFEDNLDINSSFWPINDGKEKINDIKDLKN